MVDGGFGPVSIFAEKTVAQCVGVLTRFVSDKKKRRDIENAFREAIAAADEKARREGHTSLCEVGQALTRLLANEAALHRLSDSYIFGAADLSQLVESRSITVTDIEPYVAALKNVLVPRITSLLSSEQRAVALVAGEQQQAQADRVIETLSRRIDATRPGATQSPSGSRLPRDRYYVVPRPAMEDLVRADLEQYGIAKISGPGGVGKSTLATHIAHHNYKDHTLYLALDAVPASEWLNDIAAQLRLADPRGVEEALERYDGLLLLDNMEMEHRADVEELLMPKRGSPLRVLITARDQTLLNQVEGAAARRLDLFSFEEAIECFRKHLGQRVEEDADDIRAIIERVELLPLAVDVAARTLRARLTLTPAQWIEAFDADPNFLSLDDRRIDAELSEEEIRRRRIVARVIQIGWDDLPNGSLELLRAMTQFDLETGGRSDHISSVADVAPAIGEVEIARLEERGIVRHAPTGVAGKQRYRLHRLVFDILSADYVKEDEKQRLHDRYIRVFLEFVSSLQGLNPYHTILPMTDERANLLTIAQHLIDAKHDILAQFAVAVAQDALVSDWPIPLQHRLLHSALEALPAGDLEIRPGILEALGDLCLREAKPTAARDWYSEALATFRDGGHKVGEANVLRALGEISLRAGRLGDAEQSFDIALSIYRADSGKQRIGEANVLHMLGIVAMGRLDLETGRRRFEAARKLFSAEGAQLGEANSLHELGRVSLHLGQREQAKERLNKALDIYAQMGQKLGMGSVLETVAGVLAAEDSQDAESTFRKSLNLRTQAMDQYGLRSGWAQLGRFYRSAARPRAAILALEASLRSIKDDLDELGFTLSLREQFEIFHAMGEAPATLATVKLLTDRGEFGGAERASQQLDRVPDEDERARIRAYLADPAWIERARAEAIEQARERYPDFERRFLSGELSVLVEPPEE